LEVARNGADGVVATVTEAFVTYFIQAVSESKTAAVEAMIRGGMDANTTDKGRLNNRALHHACSFSEPSIIALLCENGADANATNASGATPLHDAAERSEPSQTHHRHTHLCLWLHLRNL
jgi:ankyrin repeat protein